MVQYRGQLMPLINMDPSQVMAADGARQPVLVFQDDEHSMGLMVDQIVDIVEARLNVELGAELPGRIGSAVVAGQATEIIDTGYYLRQAYADWFGSTDRDRAKGRKVMEDMLSAHPDLDAVFSTRLSCRSTAPVTRSMRIGLKPVPVTRLLPTSTSALTSMFVRTSSSRGPSPPRATVKRSQRPSGMMRPASKRRARSAVLRTSSSVQPPSGAGDS